MEGISVADLTSPWPEIWPDPVIRPARREYPPKLSADLIEDTPSVPEPRLPEDSGAPDRTRTGDQDYLSSLPRLAHAAKKGSRYFSRPATGNTAIVLEDPAPSAYSIVTLC